jgi:hypothetical protein
MSIKKIILLLTIFLLNITPLFAKKFTIMLSPEGDTNNAGRTLAEGFERGFNRQCAETLKEQLEHDEAIRVILSHASGEPANQEQKENFENRLEIDLYVSINFYPADKPSLAIYSYRTTLFDPPVDQERLTLYPTKKAYVQNQQKTNRLTKHWQSLTRYEAQLAIIYPQAIPLKQLEGIIAPAFALECGAQKIIDIHAYLKPISDILTDIVHDKTN